MTLHPLNKGVKLAVFVINEPIFYLLLRMISDISGKIPILPA